MTNGEKNRILIILIATLLPYIGTMDDMKTKIINNYRKISRFIFYYLIFLVAFIVALLFFQRTVSQSSTVNVFQTNTTLLVQKTKLIAEFNKFLKQSIQDNDVQMYILQWDFQTKQWFIKSVNNLISYKWFIVPRYFYIYNTIPVKPENYFSGNNYDISELETFINTFVFTKKISIDKSFARVQLPLSKTLVDDFNLSCIFENKLSKSACNHYLNDFLDSFFVYNISIDYSGLKKIFTTIKNIPIQKWRFCGSLSKYFLYANDQSDFIKDFFVECGKTYEDSFKRTTLFMEIQKTLENQSFEKTTYKDNLLNEYKLLSYQQQIYQDFFINKIDSYKINSYFDFIKELLKKNGVPSFYKDEIYRYNNRYLSLVLEKMAYQSNTFSQNIWNIKISSLLTTLVSLNEGDLIFNFSWLNNEIWNTLLIPQKNIQTWINTTIDQTEKIQKKIQNISYLSIEKQEISGSIIDLIAYIKFFSPDKNETIKSHIIMEYKNDMLVIKSIDLQNKPEINDVIKNILLIQNFSLWELYSYISKNLVFYEQTNAPISSSTDLCPGLQIIKDITIISCSNTWTTLEQNGLRYEFTIKNGGIENITISDKILENSIKTSYGAIVWNNYILLDTIKAILAYHAPALWHEWTTNAIVVFEKIQQYLWVKANDIADKSWTILVDISLGWINFIINYVLKNNSVGPWYFKDIFVNNKPYLIQNLNLLLDDTHQNSINSFVIDPLTTIKNTDFTARQNYNEFIKTQK